jgi:hypothetical protein
MARLPNVREGTLNPASPATQRRQGIADGTHAAVGATNGATFGLLSSKNQLVPFFYPTS